MRIAIIGTGISGLVCAHLLHPEHDLTIFEAGDHIGGHTNTVDVSVGGRNDAVDTGFIVFNDRTYPNFIKLMSKLGVAAQTSSMSFSVKCERTGLEYNGTSLDALFAQRRNLVRPSFLRMVSDILRFNKESLEVLADGADDELTLGDYLARKKYSAEFLEHYLIPIGASIWSADPAHFGHIPARFFVGFLRNHGMLSVNDRPVWRTIKGGSREYVKRIVVPFRDRIRLNSPVVRIERDEAGATVKVQGVPPERFDKVIVAAHSNQALAMLADPSVAEHEVLSATPYQPNDTLLHTDDSVLPKSRKAWAAWNYHLLAEERHAAALTYNMNILQSIQAPHTYCVTLNRTEDVNPAKRLRRFGYEHPIFSTASTRAQGRWEEINGVRNTYYCGAYWGFGFHEDGVNSALRVCRAFGKEL